MTRFIARKNTGGVVPPIPPEPTNETSGGWAGVYNSGAGVIGGFGGITKSYTNFITLLEDLIDSGNGPSAATPEIYVYTGVDDFDISDGINRQYEIQDISNKTIYCSSGQTIRNGGLRFTNCENIIVRNIKRTYYFPHSDHIIPPPPSEDAVNRDAFTFNLCTGIWADHLEVDGRNQYGLTTDIDYFDGCIDMNLTNYITVSNCYFYNTNRGILIGYSDTGSSTGALGFGVTIRNTRITNIYQRCPRTRFINLGLHQSLIEWVPVWGTSVSGRPTQSYTIGLGKQSQIYSECNYYSNGDRLCTNYDNETVKESGMSSTNDFVGSYVRDTTFLRSENVEWNPNTTTNYELPINITTPAEAKLYCETWAGAKYHLKVIV